MSEKADVCISARIASSVPHHRNRNSSSRSSRGVLAGWWPGVFVAAEHSIDTLHAAQHSLVVQSFLGENRDVVADDAVNQVIANSLKATRATHIAVGDIQAMLCTQYNHWPLQDHGHPGFDVAAHLHERRAASHGTILGGRDNENNSLLVADLGSRVPALKHLQHVIMISSMM